MSPRRHGRRPHNRPAGTPDPAQPRPLVHEVADQLDVAEPFEPAPAEPAGAVAIVDAPAPAPIAAAADEESDRKAACTLAQLRRFVKSRPYVPLHELRRRFGIEGDDDDVSPVPTNDGTVFVGLPEPEARLLGELVRAGDVGFELLYDPSCPAIVGVYPMRPVARG